jgi:hypothetical protein
MVEIKILGSYRDQADAARQAALATGKSRGVARLDRISAALEH